MMTEPLVRSRAKSKIYFPFKKGIVLAKGFTNYPIKSDIVTTDARTSHHLQPSIYIRFVFTNYLPSNRPPFGDILRK